MHTALAEDPSLAPCTRTGWHKSACDSGSGGHLMPLVTVGPCTHMHVHTYMQMEYINLNKRKKKFPE